MPLTPTIEEAVKVIVVLCNGITMTTHFSWDYDSDNPPKRDDGPEGSL